jgi:hypothetical protein
MPQHARQGVHVRTLRRRLQCQLDAVMEVYDLYFACEYHALLELRQASLHPRTELLISLRMPPFIIVISVLKWSSRVVLERAALTPSRPFLQASGICQRNLLWLS